MNDTPDRDREENDRLLRLLEAVTAERTHLAGQDEQEVRSGEHDQSHLAERDEYAGLRATWLALGRLLDSADEPLMIEARSVSEEMGAAVAIAKTKPLAGLPSDRKAWPLRRLATVAAACGILLAVGGLGLNWWRAGAGRQRNQALPVVDQMRQPSAQPRQDAPKAPAPTLVQSETQASPHKATVPKQSTSPAKTSTWDDAIDDQIASVSQQIESVRHTWGHRVDDVDLVQYRVDEVSTGLSKDAL